VGSNYPLTSEAEYVEYITSMEIKCGVKLRIQNLYSDIILNLSKKIKLKGNDKFKNLINTLTIINNLMLRDNYHNLNYDINESHG
jgi:hypothetical protein